MLCQTRAPNRTLYVGPVLWFWQMQMNTLSNSLASLCKKQPFLPTFWLLHRVKHLFSHVVPMRSSWSTRFPLVVMEWQGFTIKIYHKCGHQLKQSKCTKSTNHFPKKSYTNVRWSMAVDRVCGLKLIQSRMKGCLGRQWRIIKRNYC